VAADDGEGLALAITGLLEHEKSALSSRLAGGLNLATCRIFLVRLQKKLVSIDNREMGSCTSRKLCLVVFRDG
jgi:hypothetical protein